MSMPMLHTGMATGTSSGAMDGHINEQQMHSGKPRHSHTIVLVQRSPGKVNTRTWLEHESVSEAMTAVIKLYEDRLTQLNPHMKAITYDIQDLFDFIDALADLSVLVFVHESQTYAPFGKEWVKSRVFNLLKRQAA